jgi:hypothetical protein
MNGSLAGFAIFLIGVVPLSVKPAWAVGMIAIGTGVLCIAGLIRRSLSATVTGCVLATINLAVALWSSGGSLSVFGAIAFGLALLYLLESTHFAERFAGAEFDRSASRALMAWWITRAAICIAAEIMLELVASALTVLMPVFGRPLISAFGAFVAFVAALSVGFFRKGSASDGSA